MRYHIITCIAVFLALGLGLLLGGTLGEQVIVKEQVQVLDRLEDRFTQVKAEHAKLLQQHAETDRQAKQLKDVVAQVSDHYVRERLLGKKVAILSLEPVDLSVLLTTLEKAGANVTSTTLVTNSHPLMHPQELPELSEKLGTAANASSAVRMQRLTSRLADDLYGELGGSEVVRLLQENNVLTVSGTLGAEPDHVIVIGGASEQSRLRVQALDVPLVKSLLERNLAVIAVEPSEAAHSGVRYYREAGISTVDNIDQVTGLVALVDVLCGAKGHYGVKKTAEALLPKTAGAKEVSVPVE